jgi:signal recognition particle subunit SRP54
MAQPTPEQIAALQKQFGHKGAGPAPGPGPVARAAPSQKPQEAVPEPPKLPGLGGAKLPGLGGGLLGGLNPFGKKKS